MQSYSVHEAKTHLSRLLKKVQAGEDIIITSSGKAVATLTAPPKQKKRIILGDLEHLADQFVIPDNFDDPMPDEWFFPDENKFKF